MRWELPIELIGTTFVIVGRGTIEANVDIVVCFYLVSELLYNLLEIEVTFVIRKLCHLSRM